MADVSSGIKSKAAFRIDRRSSSVAYPTSSSDDDAPRQNGSSDERIGTYDKVPLLSEDVFQVRKYDPSNILAAKSGISSLDEIAILPQGSVKYEAHYLGIGPLIACAMGFEKVRVNGAEESPSLEDTGGGDDTTLSCTSSTLDIQNAEFVSGDVDKWARITKNNSNVAGINQVRRITSYINAQKVGITPNWTTIPSDAWGVEWGQVWKHTYECAADLHEDTFANLFSNVMVYPDTDLMVRRGCFVIDKQVARYAANCCMIDSLKFKLTTKGLELDFSLVPFSIYRETATAGNNLNPSYWNYSASSLAINERIIFPHAVFRIDDFSSSTALTAADKLSISELELTLNNSLAKDDQGTGSTKYRLEPVRNGVRTWTGYFVLPRFTGDSRYIDWESGTIKMADLIFTGTTELLSGSGLYNVLSIFLRSLKITNVKTATGGPGVRRERVEFQCIEPTVDPAGMPATTTGAANSEVIVQLQNNDPFNAFMDQNEEDPY